MIPASTGFLLVVLVSLPLAALVLVVRRLYRLRRKLPLRRWHERLWLFYSSLALLAVYALVGAWGLGVEPHWVELTRTEIPIQGGVLGRERLRVVHLSDLHLGPRFGRAERRAVELVAECKPDLILLTGDYMDVRSGSFSLSELATALSGLKPAFGVWAVGGPVDEKFVTRELLRSAGVEWLEDETRLVEGPDGTRLRLAGRGAWPLLSMGDIFDGLDATTPTILLQHGPAGVVDSLQSRGAARVDLALCGHTHGGQIVLPLWGPLLPVEDGPWRGRGESAGVPVYVNRGLGTTGLPMRLGARPEVALIELVRK